MTNEPETLESFFIEAYKLDRLRGKNPTLREIEDELDWIENQACDDDSERTQPVVDGECVRESQQKV